MSPSGAEVLRQIKSRIDEVDPGRCATSSRTGPSWSTCESPRNGPRATFPAPGTSPRATSSRGSRARSRTARQHVILYCASGNRSAWATRTLVEDLGYENVESMTGGFTLWKDRGYEVESRAR